MNIQNTKKGKHVLLFLILIYSLTIRSHHYPPLQSNITQFLPYIPLSHLSNEYPLIQSHVFLFLFVCLSFRVSHLFLYVRGCIIVNSPTFKNSVPTRDFKRTKRSTLKTVGSQHRSYDFTKVHSVTLQYCRELVLLFVGNRN